MNQRTGCEDRIFLRKRILRVFFALTATAIAGCGSQSTRNLPAGSEKIVAELESLGASISVTESSNLFVDFYNCQRIGPAMKLLSDLPAVEKLNFSSVKIKDDQLAVLAKLNRLKHLSLNATPITDDGLSHLAGLVELEYLILNDTKISDAGIAHLAALKKLRGLGLFRTRVTDTGLAQLERLDQLEWVRLSGPGVTADGAETLREVYPDAEISYVEKPHVMITGR